MTTKTLRWRFFSLAGRLTRAAAALLCISPALALGNPVQLRPGPTVSHFIPSLTAPSATDPRTGQPKVPADSRQPGARWSSTAYCPANLAQRRHRPYLLESSPDRRAPIPFTSCSNAKAASFRWIRAKQATTAWKGHWV